MISKAPDVAKVSELDADVATPATPAVADVVGEN